MASQDTEITLGMGKLLGLFIVLAAVCGVFFSLGYSAGKNTAKPTTVATADTTAAPAVTTGKPSSTARTPAESKPDLTYYKSVEQKEPDSKLAAADPVKTEEKAAAEPSKPASPAPEMTRPASGYLVQVAAVSKQEDAQALADALGKKSYRVQIATNPPNDNLYHVQIGPFADLTEAESTRNRLIGDGYNPILKK